MPIDQPFNVYREQLTSKHQGIALWNPNPIKGLYDCGHVSIGDVGYLYDGSFVRMFNVTLPWDDPSNGKHGKPYKYKPLEQGHFVNVRKSEFYEAEYHSPHVAKVENSGNVQAETPDEAKGRTYKCKTRSRGALLSLPHGGHHEDVIRTKAFEDYIRDNVVSWFTWARNNKLGVERIEDLILVTGCTLVTAWAAAAFDDYTMPVDSTAISLNAQKYDCGRAQSIWRNIHGNVEYHNSHFDPSDKKPLPRNQSVFIRGFRAKRRPFFGIRHLRAAAEPLPDDPVNHLEDEIQVTRAPGVQKYRDPLIGVLDYIVEKCFESGEDKDTIAVAHDDELQLIEDVEPLTADAVEKFLRDEQMPLLVEKGVATLRDPRDVEPPVSEEKKAIFYAAAELIGEPVPLVIHPALTKYNLKLEVANSADQDYDLPKEELTSSAVYPPMRLLKLENCLGYPHTISIEASDEGVTVQDALRTIHEDLRTRIPTREFYKLSAEERAAIDAGFGERYTSEEELGKGPRRIDLLCGRDRLQILPIITSDGTLLPILTSQGAESSDELNIAGPSRIPAYFGDGRA